MVTIDNTLISCELKDNFVTFFIGCDKRRSDHFLWQKAKSFH